MNSSWWMLANSSSRDVPQLDDDVKIQKELYSIMLPVIIAFCLASGIVSSCVVAATPWVRRPMSPTVTLSISLAAANTVFSVALTVAVVVNSYLPAVRDLSAGDCVGLSIEAVRMGSVLVQILHLLVVAINHYLGTLRPLHYAATMTPATLKAILFPLWIAPMVGMFIVFSSIPDQGFQSPHCENNYFYIKGLTFRVVWACLFFGPTVMIALVYCHIFHILRDRGLHLVTHEQRNQLRRNIKTVRTTALIVGSFVLGWGPAVIKFLLVCEECVVSPEEMGVIARLASGATVNIIYCLKVFTDTFIYAVQLREVRVALLAMWRGARGLPANNTTRGISTRASKVSHLASTKLSQDPHTTNRRIHSRLQHANKRSASLMYRPNSTASTCHNSPLNSRWNSCKQPHKVSLEILDFTVIEDKETRLKDHLAEKSFTQNHL